MEKIDYIFQLLEEQGFMEGTYTILQKGASKELAILKQRLRANYLSSTIPTPTRIKNIKAIQQRIAQLERSPLKWEEDIDNRHNGNDISEIT